VYEPLKASKTTKRSGSVATKRVKSAEGKTVTLHTIDADSQTFGDDFSYVFRQNVKRARQENKRLTGIADSAARKG